MGLVIEFNEGWGFQTKSDIEDALRKCIAEPPASERWVVSLAAGLAQDYCEVRVKTPRQTRTRFFFEELRHLPAAITAWINLYPLR